MSHYRPYPQYKDSGVEWLGKVPEGWKTTRIKHVITFITGWTPPTGDSSSFEGDNLWANISDLGAKTIYDTAKRISDEAVKKSRIKAARKGNLLFSFKLSTGQVSFAGQDMYTNEAIATFTPSKEISLAYAYYAFPDFIVRNAAENIYGAKLLNQELIRSAMLVIPQREEQDSIASFLDRETDRIDTLIAKKTRFIELLKEKRQAIITQAVTKGLDDTVPMKDSGVKWLGMVPEHWEVVPSCWLFYEGKSRAKPEDQHLSATQKYGVIPLAEYEQLEGRQVTHAFKNIEQRKHVEIDDFVISMRSFEGGIERVKAPGCVRSSYVVLIAQDQAHVGFFSYLFKSRAYIQGLQATSAFIRDGQDLSYNNFRQVRLPLPSVDEQRKIAELLERTISRIDALSVKTLRSIELLKEHRAALITAAVTGKIDVRGETA